MHNVDVLIIGAGQAGLAIGYFLKQSSLSFALLEANSAVGESWRRRYDSLVLFTPRRFSCLPGMRFPGDPNGFPTKDETADYLESYAKNFALPVHLNTKVLSMSKTEKGFTVDTDQGSYHANKVVVATGPFQKPFVPAFAASISSDVVQVHSSTYRNPASLREGSVLVVGAGNSGAQLAVELAKDRDVFLSTGGSIRFKPLKLLGRSIFWYFDKLGMLKADASSMFGGWLKKQPEQVYGYELKNLLERGVITPMQRAVNAEGDRVFFEDGSELRLNNVVWATGYRAEYGWITIDGALDSQGRPNHHHGVSPVNNLYFLGLPWQSSRGSALLGWVQCDAAFLAERLSAAIKKS
ncbi:flavin-containing monooxygenase [Paenibacillus sp. MBLB4367]|uniref:flavin-containing monooxygenase n=1 Tax=Paenibacillus sp. MBLB4367 TaxID=3384767 RepID=UPI00390817DF